MLNACRSSTGDGFGFKRDRAIAFNSKTLRSHPMSLPSPDEFDYAKTLLVWEEAGQSLTTMRQILVDLNDIDRAIALLSRSDIADKQQIIDVLNKLHQLLNDKSRYGLDFHQIKMTIPDIVNTVLLTDLLKPDLSILDTVDGIADSEFEQSNGKDKRELAKLHALLKRETTLYSGEIEKKIEREILKQWLVEFLDILSGTITHGDLHIQNEKLTVSMADSRLRDIADMAAANLYLDATIDLADLEMRLDASVHTIRQSGALVMPPIYQVSNLGRLGMQRREKQTCRVDAIIARLTQLDPTTQFIDFKKFTKSDKFPNVDYGVWFRDSRGSNDFNHAKTLAIVGTPCANIAMLRAEYVALTCLHPIDKDPDFAAFVDRHIFANVQQCLGRKSGDRCHAGDKIYFLSDFDLGNVPHIQIKAGEITAEAMSNLEILQAKVAEVINGVTDSGFDLVNASERQLSEYFGISRGSLINHFEWIKPLLNALYNKLIQDFNENLAPLTDQSDLEAVESLTGMTEFFLTYDLTLKESLACLFEFFSQHIPRYLHDYVLAKLSTTALDKLFSALAVVAIA